MPGLGHWWVLFVLVLVLVGIVAGVFWLGLLFVKKAKRI